MRLERSRYLKNMMNKSIEKEIKMTLLTYLKQNNIITKDMYNFVMNKII